jgi:NADPH2:quinone reductase
MAHAIRMHRTGGPEVLVWEPVTVGEPQAGEVRLRHTAVGLNYVDTYHRSGLYPVASLPAVPGVEAAGVVEAVGPGVSEVQPGDRVGYATGPLGAYAEQRLIPADRLVPLPAGVDDRVAAAVMLKGLTAQFLLRQTYRVQAGETLLVHAAAGGVGLLLCQWANRLGATVIGTVGSEEKAALARAHGCHHTILYNQEDFVARVRALTDGAGVPVVYDSVGRTTFMGSLDCLRPRGMMVNFGQASGPVPPIEIGLLGAKGSLYLTRPSLFVYMARRPDLLAAAAELFAAIAEGWLKIEINQTFPLDQAEAAHRALEARATTGSSLLLP